MKLFLIIVATIFIVSFTTSGIHSASSKTFTDTIPKNQTSYVLSFSKEDYKFIDSILRVAYVRLGSAMLYEDAVKLKEPLGFIIQYMAQQRAVQDSVYREVKKKK